MVDFLELRGLLDEASCAALLAELRAAGGGPAGLLGRDGDDVRPQVRKATRLAVSEATRERVTRLLIEQMPVLERHFGLALGRCEEPQFLRYRTGDFFVAHQDGNTPLVFDSTRFRKVSAIIFLSRQSEESSPGDYEGGSLVLHGPWSGPELRVAMPASPGSLVAFRAETTHEVMPVTRGERFTIASWYHGAPPGY
jgi:SM-20-related protein